MRSGVLTIASAALAVLSLSACQHAQESLGLAKVTPDEFRVVTKAPLVIPPEYAMRPPAPGEPRPQELQPESAARLALLGQRSAETRSEGEKLFVQRAGADHADPLARYVVDDEFGAIAYKDKTFADKVMFWRKGESAALSNAVSATNPEPLAAAAEAQRLKALTGGKVIVIKKRQDGKTKLPGL
jgi:hypothetical protein